MALRDILAAEGLVRTAGISPMETLTLVESMGGEMTHMNAGTWATFKNSKARDKAFDALSARGANINKEGAKDIRFLTGKTAAGFNRASPFARKIETLVEDLMEMGSRISVSMGRGEFSSKMGMQIRVINPRWDLFPHEEEEEEGEDPFQDLDRSRIRIQKVEKELSEFFGLPVHTENIEDTAVVFTVELRVQP